ncbi:hypothetical protein J5U22_00737 [Saccharolobus shibatae]|uniref:Uncharacterized protein n=1 Tax=Saccharolobus shibatae TaxID=2286 RepID=A0A8F5BZD4_9CREN|nr:hypothetical protein J5U22_00737 [Saccharolobus shibatae]
MILTTLLPRSIEGLMGLWEGHLLSLFLISRDPDSVNDGSPTFQMGVDL